MVDGSRCAVQLGSSVEMTADREAAKASAVAIGTALVLEVQQSSTQRGANIEWLTQCPASLGQQCVTFSPLMTFDVTRTRIEGAHTVVELRPTARDLSGGQQSRSTRSNSLAGSSRASRDGDDTGGRSGREDAAAEGGVDDPGSLLQQQPALAAAPRRKSAAT